MCWYPNCDTNHVFVSIPVSILSTSPLVFLSPSSPPPSPNKDRYFSRSTEMPMSHRFLTSPGLVWGLTFTTNKKENKQENAIHPRCAIASRPWQKGQSRRPFRGLISLKYSSAVALGGRSRVPGWGTKGVPREGLEEGRLPPRRCHHRRFHHRRGQQSPGQQSPGQQSPGQPHPSRLNR